MNWPFKYTPLKGDEEVLAMLGKQSGPDGDGHSYLDHVGRDSFYGFLALHRKELFSDEDFAEFYCPDNGRPSVPPSLLATTLLLQTYEGVSDEEAKARADFDLRWKVALGIGLEERPFAKSTLQLFRARLVLHERMQTVFQKSLDFARHTGYLRNRRLKVVLDITYILGWGAVKDTYNLLADGIVMLARQLAGGVCSDLREWASERHLGGYFGSSLKGEAGIDWDDPEARRVFLESVVADADRLLAAAREVMETLPADDPERGRLHDAATLLGRLLLQDIERGEEGTRLKQGVSPDRIVSVHDPEMRHGGKSASRRFDGHKAHLAVDPESQLILAADVMAGNAPDRERALQMVEQAEANAGAVVAETVGDCAYGDGSTRRIFADAARKLVAKMAGGRTGSQFPKEDFQIDLESMSCVCPAGHATRKVVSIGSGDRYGAPGVPLRAFRFDAAICAACPLRPSCMRARPGKGRLVMIHPREALLQEARAFQRSEAFAPYRKLRQAAEHRLARLMQLGVRQARFFGRTKTLFQLLTAAAVANLTLVAIRAGLMRDRNHPQPIISIHVHALFMVRHVFATLSPRSELGFSATLLDSILRRVSNEITRIAATLNLEHVIGADGQENPVALDIRNLTLIVDKPEGPVTFHEIGSGKNWLGYGIATHLALHRHFEAQRRPVPSFLILDQPTQVFYPDERDKKLDRSVADLSDDDREEVRRLFTVISEAVSKAEGRMQVIITDHADLPEEWFRDAVVERWRGGDALVPNDW